MTESGRHGRARSTLRAVIFDFNGVLVDDERLHAAAAAEVLAREEGIALPEADYFDRYFGLDDRALFAAALRDAGRGGDSAAAPGPDRIAALVARKAAVYLEALEGGVQLLPGARRLVERLAAAALPLAIVSGALRPEIAAILARKRLDHRFAVIVSAEEVHAGKPDPAGYLLACQRLARQVEGLADLRPEQCLAIEDSPPGVAAACAAGLVCLALAGSRPAAALTAAHDVVESLEDLDPEGLALRFAAARSR